jgi:hypothetical protein
VIVLKDIVCQGGFYRTISTRLHNVAYHRKQENRV